MRYIKQRHKNGSGVACLAMVTGHSYERVRQWFKDKYRFDPVKHLLGRDLISYYLTEHDYWIKRKRTNNGKSVRGFAYVYILYVQMEMTYAMHYIVVDTDGIVCDPARGARADLDCYHVVEIIGCMNHYHIGREARIG